MRRGTKHRPESRLKMGICPNRSRTGIPGVGLALVAIKGRKQPHITAHCGQVTKKFNTVRLGRDEALRRALKVRAEYERSLL